MGQYLGRQLNTDQLEFKLANLDVGTASVQDITLNTDYINESLDKAGFLTVKIQKFNNIAMEESKLSHLSMATSRSLKVVIQT